MASWIGSISLIVVTSKVARCPTAEADEAERSGRRPPAKADALAEVRLRGDHAGARREFGQGREEALPMDDHARERATLPDPLPGR